MSERRNNVPPKKPKKVNPVKSKSPSSNKFKKLVGWRDADGRIYADASKIKVVKSESKIDYIDRNPDTAFEPVPDSELQSTLAPAEPVARPEKPKRNGKLIAGIAIAATLVVVTSVALIFIIPRIIKNNDSSNNNSSKSTRTASSTRETTTASTTDLSYSETRNTTQATTSAEPDSYSTGDYSYFENRRYQVIEKVMTWTEAEAYCEELGGHLVTITSVEEQEYIYEINPSGLKLWIGGYKDSSDNWNWITGENWNYTNWADREPNNDDTVYGFENYIAMWPMAWNDLNEENNSQLSGFICEWDGYKVVRPEDTATLVAEPVDITDLITDIGSSSEDDESYGNVYPAYHLIDDDLDTSWAEGADGDGIGEYISIYIPKGTIITGLVVYTGYCKSENVFYKNSAPSVIYVSSGNDGYRVYLNTAETGYAADNFDVASEGVEVTFPSPIISDGELRITLIAVREGTDWSDTNMSEIKLIGSPAP